MSRIYKISMTDLNGAVSFGGGGGGSSGGSRGRRERREANSNRPRPAFGGFDFNRNGRITDELTAGATIAAGAVTMATPAPGARVAGGLTIGAGIAGYADASR